MQQGFSLRQRTKLDHFQRRLSQRSLLEQRTADGMQGCVERMRPFMEAVACIFRRHLLMAKSG
jgi:hypothetical protein